MTPSATAATSAACSGFETPIPTQIGADGVSRILATTSPAPGAQLAPLAGDAHPGHGVDEARTALDDLGGPPGRRRGRDQQDGRDPRSKGHRLPLVELLEAEVGHDRSADPGCSGQPGEPLEPEVRDRG